MKNKKRLLLSALVTGTCLALAPAWAADSPTDRMPNNSGAVANPGTRSGYAIDGSMGNNTTSTSGSTQSSGMMSQSNTSGQGDIRSLQQALRDKGFDPGPIDGMMGPQTRQALQSFQRSKNITATGELDNETSQQLGLQRPGSMSNRSSGASGMSSSGLPSDLNSPMGTTGGNRGGMTSSGSSSSPSSGGASSGGK
ncbi:MAG TPA: peptidoglycan-binding domain-containing protein [Candidatus Acidoferrales bacterium]|nr:peptidoglycan-binding domain-containing protein [Candidatus Acidoferrales bacterium]